MLPSLICNPLLSTDQLTLAPRLLKSSAVLKSSGMSKRTAPDFSSSLPFFSEASTAPVRPVSPGAAPRRLNAKFSKRARARYWAGRGSGPCHSAVRSCRVPCGANSASTLRASCAMGKCSVRDDTAAISSVVALSEPLKCSAFSLSVALYCKSIGCNLRLPAVVSANREAVKSSDLTSRFQMKRPSRAVRSSSGSSRPKRVRTWASFTSAVSSRTASLRRLTHARRPPVPRVSSNGKLTHARHAAISV